MSDADRAVGATPADTSRVQDRLRKFRQLNRLLWLCWLGLLVWAGICYWRNAVALPSAVAGASSRAGNCPQLFLDPNKMPLAGKAL
jgi:hypothetical protein